MTSPFYASQADIIDFWGIGSSASSFKQAAEPKIGVETKELESWYQELDEMVVRLDIEDKHIEQAIHDLRDRIYAYLH